MQLKDLKVIVTGGGRGMGAHFARRLAEAGAQVAAGDMNEAALAELPAGIHKRKLDVRSESDCVEFAAWARERHGRAQLAREQRGHHPRRPARATRQDDRRDQEDDAEDWRAVLDVNLIGRHVHGPRGRSR